MEKTAKIVSVTEKTRTNPKTQEIVYFSTVKMDNGDEYTISRGKSQTWFFKEWKDLVYKIEKINEYDKIVIKEDKPAYTGKTWFSKDYTKDWVAFAISYAKDLVTSDKVELKDFIKTADKIYDRMLSKYKWDVKVPEAPVVAKKPIETETSFGDELKAKSQSDNDLPLPF